MLFEQQAAAIQQNGGVYGRLARLASGRKGHARQHGGRQIARGRGQLIDGRTAAGQKARLFKEVGGRIAADDQFGKDSKPRALGSGATAGRNNFFKISGEIPDSWIDLGQRDLHTSSLIQCREPLAQLLAASW